MFTITICHRTEDATITLVDSFNGQIDDLAARVAACRAAVGLPDTVGSWRDGLPAEHFAPIEPPLTPQSTVDSVTSERPANPPLIRSALNQPAPVTVSTAPRPVESWTGRRSTPGRSTRTGRSTGSWPGAGNTASHAIYSTGLRRCPVWPMPHGRPSTKGAWHDSALSTQHSEAKPIYTLYPAFSTRALLSAHGLAGLMAVMPLLEPGVYMIREGDRDVGDATREQSGDWAIMMRDGTTAGPGCIVV